jgi:hypothetical protein
MPTKICRLRPLNQGLRLGVLVVGVLLASLALAVSARSGPEPTAPTHTITITGGPDPISNIPFPTGGAPGFSWKLSVNPPVDTAGIGSVKACGPGGGSMSSDCYTGGLNQGVGSLQIKGDCLQPLEATYTVTFVIDGEDHPINVRNPRAKTAAHVDFGLSGIMTPDFDTFAVRVLNSNEQIVTNYTDTAWVTAFTLNGSRVRLNDTAGNMVAIEIVDGIGSISLTVMERVEGDTVIFQIEAPRLDTARSKVDL